MSLGLLGQKLGMTRIFTDDGISIPVTVLLVTANRVVQVKTLAVDGYNSIQVTNGIKKVSHITKPLKGHYAKAGTEAGIRLKEFILAPQEIKRFAPSDTFTVNIFTIGQMVDITGYSKGKGFSGVIKRHHFSSNRATHGNSLSHNTPGSIGQRQDPGRVFPGKKMAGHLGAIKVTTQNLKIIRIDFERNLLIIKGAVPGSKGSQIVIHPSVKAGTLCK